MKKILSPILILSVLLCCLTGFTSCKKGPVEISKDEFMEKYTKYYNSGAEYSNVTLDGACFYNNSETGKVEINATGSFELKYDENYAYVYTSYKPADTTDYWKFYVRRTPEVTESVIKAFENSGTWKYYADGKNIIMTVRHEDAVLMTRTFNKEGYLISEGGGYNEIKVKKYSK